MNIKGLKITDIMNMTWDELNSIAKNSPKDFRTITSRLVSASNKRIKRLETAVRGKSSLAYQSVESRGSKFSVRGKDMNQLKSEFASAKHFLGMKTSTKSGWNKYRTEMEKRTGYATEGESLNWSDRTWKKYWKVYRVFEENHGATFKKGDSDRIKRMLTEIMEKNDKRRSADSFQRLIEDEYSDMYESDEETDIDDYFPLE